MIKFRKRDCLILKSIAVKDVKYFLILYGLEKMTICQHPDYDNILEIEGKIPF